MIQNTDAGRGFITIAEEDLGFESILGHEKKFRAQCLEMERQLAHNMKLGLK